MQATPDMCVWRTEAGWNIADAVEINALHAGGSREKTPAGALTLLQGFGG
jgi:hypothetical protein